VLGANRELAGAEVELVDLDARERRLKMALATVAGDYDFVLVDCPPSLSLLTLNGLCAAHGVIVPMQCEYFALEGLSDLVNTIKQVHANLNPELHIIGLLRVMFDPRVTLQQQVSEQLKAHFGDKVFNTVIPRNVRLAEAPSYGQPGVVFDPASKGAQAFVEFAREMVARLGRPRCRDRRMSPAAPAAGRPPVADRGRRPQCQRPTAAAVDGRLAGAAVTRQGQAGALHQCRGRKAGGSWPTSWPRGRALFAEAGLPLVVRVTPFSQPAGIDQALAAAGLQRFDDTLVLAADLAGMDLGSRIAARRALRAGRWRHLCAHRRPACAVRPPRSSRPMPRGWPRRRCPTEAGCCAAAKTCWPAASLRAKARWSGSTTSSPRPRPATRACHARPGARSSPALRRHWRPCPGCRAG
jgi:hypothetical protein